MVLNHVLNLAGTEWARHENKCDLCGMVFRRVNTLHKHRAKVHNAQPPPATDTEDGR